ncbi:radical SAM protein [bacterium]|nr:radical SAM protein [bacterium]
MKSLSYLKYAKKMFYKKDSLPLYLVYFITLNCNIKCKHCLLGDLPPTKDELTIDEIEKISQSMDDFLFLLPTGGEPFLRKDIAEIVRIFHVNNKIKIVGIPTNGSLTQRVVESTKLILENNPNLEVTVDVSIDGISEDHDHIRGVKGLFQKTIATYKELRELEKHYKNFNINVETTVSSYNDSKLFDIYHYATKELEAKNLFTLLCRGKPREPSSKFFNINNYEKYAQLLEKSIKSQTLSGYDNFPFCDIINAKRIIRHQIITKLVRENQYQVPCYGGSLGAAILSKGEVLPCELHNDLPLGNLREVNYDFKKIWFSEKANHARQYIQKSKCFCTYECFLTINILFNPRLLPRILKEYLAIKLAKILKRFGGKDV